MTFQDETPKNKHELQQDMMSNLSHKIQFYSSKLSDGRTTTPSRMSQRKQNQSGNLLKFIK